MSCVLEYNWLFSSSYRDIEIVAYGEGKATLYLPVGSKYRTVANIPCFDSNFQTGNVMWKAKMYIFVIAL